MNNTEVGVWYTAVSFLFFLFAGVLALLMRIQLAVPENDFLSAETYNQTFTVHGSVMMFLFAIPIRAISNGLISREWIWPQLHPIQMEVAAKA